MIYTNFQDKHLSMLGFGTMRLPLYENGEINEEAFAEMTDYAISHGVNYFDTAFPYHKGKSEIALGKVLKKYNRDSYYIASKYPGHQIMANYDPADVFEKQLKKCNVEYFDFYLLHNVYENSIGVYLDPQWGIIEYFKEQKRLGRIKHLGFSSHGRLDNLRAFLDAVGDDMEFCQIQLNWLDWTLQEAKEKVELLNARNIPIWVMEPVRGGKLCRLPDARETEMKALCPNESIPAWSFRFLQGIPGVTMILSGMSNLEQMKDNVGTFTESHPLDSIERSLLLEIAEELKDCVPCTKCGYCLNACPKGLDIPLFIATCNDLRFAEVTNSIMCLDALSEDKKPMECISCGRCKKMCPQMIEIPNVIRELNKRLANIPKWKDICKIREAEAKKLNN